MITCMKYFHCPKSPIFRVNMLCLFFHSSYFVLNTFYTAFYLFKISFIYGCSGSSLLCGGYSSCSGRASHWGFSCGEGALGAIKASVVAACGLSSWLTGWAAPQHVESSRNRD